MKYTMNDIDAIIAKHRNDGAASDDLLLTVLERVRSQQERERKGE